MIGRVIESKTRVMTNNKLRIGMFGYGCVGQGLHDVLNSSRGIKADIVKICVKDRSKERRLDMSSFTFNRDEILDDPSINLVVELIDDADEAYKIVTAAMRNGKSVVTANKRMVANHLLELVNLQEEMKVSLLYEASACASIPIIRNLEEYYDNELLFSLRGIFNGSTNFILSRMHNEDKEFVEVLEEARQKGFVETNPSLDIDGYDAKYKLCIITAHAYGLILPPEEVFHYGIRNINNFDIRYAREKGYKIKLVPFVGKTGEQEITSYVLPRFIGRDRYLYGVDDEYNGVIAEAAFADKQFFYGKGAGGHATGCAVLSDISANSYGYKYEYKKKIQNVVTGYTRDIMLDVYFRYRDESDMKRIGFSEIRESFRGPDFRYITGSVSLARLYELRDELTVMDAFIIGIG